ncbi:MAG: hypothetical protein PHG02_05300 [Oscillospiraceae bacterium]|nr:hypothetical protein [Oscillospiraceae bacterium]
MKKITILLAMMLAFSVMATACGNNSSASSSGSSSAGASSTVSSSTAGTETLTESLPDIMKKVYDGVDMDIMLIEDEITEEDSDYHLRMTRDKYEEAYISQAGMSAQAHSVVLVRTKPGTDMEAFCEELMKNGDLPQKWICAEAENVQTAYVGDVAILIMTYNDYADKLMENFKALAK